MTFVKLFISALLAASSLFFYFQIERFQTRPIDIVCAFPDLTFERPCDLQQPKKQSIEHLYVVEQRGVIRRFLNDSKVKQSEIFLDIRDQVDYDSNEQGLLGLAFDPQFDRNGYFYVNYVAKDPLRTIIARFEHKHSDIPVNPNTQRVILEILQPYSNHNGGQLSFGADGYLYIALGDGGAGGDPYNHAQNLKSALGKILRIDVSGSTPSKPYDIPPDNPFIGQDAYGEIYAYGLRNPWRFSWDKQGHLWCADVGQNLYEEVNLIVRGGNYGWKVMEASHCFEPSNNCDSSGLIMPKIEYSRHLGRSITGGFVYEGGVEKLKHHYVFADFVTGNIWAIKTPELLNNSNSKTLVNPDPLLKSGLNIASFGEDNSRELYILAFDGKIYRFS